MDTQPPQQPIPPPPLQEMNKAAIWALDVLRTQGLSFLLLGLAVFHLQGQNIELRKEMAACQREKYEVLLKALQENTEAFRFYQRHPYQK